jgi:hypothetical protein
MGACGQFIFAIHKGQHKENGNSLTPEHIVEVYRHRSSVHHFCWSVFDPSSVLRKHTPGAMTPSWCGTEFVMPTCFRLQEIGFDGSPDPGEPHLFQSKASRHDEFSATSRWGYRAGCVFPQDTWRVKNGPAKVMNTTPVSVYFNNMFRGQRISILFVLSFMYSKNELTACPHNVPFQSFFFHANKFCVLLNYWLAGRGLQNMVEVLINAILPISHFKPYVSIVTICILAYLQTCFAF